MKLPKLGDVVVISLPSNELSYPFRALVIKVVTNPWKESDEQASKMIHYRRVEDNIESCCDEFFIIDILPQIVGTAPVLRVGNQRKIKEHV